MAPAPPARRRHALSDSTRGLVYAALLHVAVSGDLPSGLSAAAVPCSFAERRRKRLTRFPSASFSSLLPCNLALCALPRADTDRGPLAPHPPQVAPTAPPPLVPAVYGKVVSMPRLYCPDLTADYMVLEARSAPRDPPRASPLRCPTRRPPSASVPGPRLRGADVSSLFLPTAARRRLGASPPLTAGVPPAAPAAGDRVGRHHHHLRPAADARRLLPGRRAPPRPPTSLAENTLPTAPPAATLSCPLLPIHAAAPHPRLSPNPHSAP